MDFLVDSFSRNDTIKIRSRCHRQTVSSPCYKLKIAANFSRAGRLFFMPFSNVSEDPICHVYDVTHQVQNLDDDRDVHRPPLLSGFRRIGGQETSIMPWLAVHRQDGTRFIITSANLIFQHIFITCAKRPVQHQLAAQAFVGSFLLLWFLLFYLVYFFLE